MIIKKNKRIRFRGRWGGESEREGGERSVHLHRHDPGIRTKRRTCVRIATRDCDSRSVTKSTERGKTMRIIMWKQSCKVEE